MNKASIIGNLTRDPELRTVNGRDGQITVCDFTVAVNRRQRGANGQEQADYFRVTAWRGLGENCHKYLSKGRKVFVAGPVSCRTYTGNDGVTRATLEVTADEVEFLSPRQDGQSAGGTAAGYQNNGYQAAQPAPLPREEQQSFQNVEDDDLPF